jgi:hypothetical protein
LKVVKCTKWAMLQKNPAAILHSGGSEFFKLTLNFIKDTYCLFEIFYCVFFYTPSLYFTKHLNL